MGYFLMLIALLIAGVAGYFSVYGLAHIFASAFWSVVIMGGVLEVGKLVATSFLYRYWADIGIMLRTYLFVAIIGLMGITSAGIFGYLSNAYQQDIVGIKDVSARIELLDTELATLSARESQINDDIGRIGSNYVSARQNLIKQYAPEKQQITARIASIRTEKLELSTKLLEVEAHTGPIIYIAKAMDRGIDEAVIWMICLIIFVFDPLAVALTLGANIALIKKAESRKLPAPRDGTRPEFLSQDILDKCKESGEARLQERMLDMKRERDGGLNLTRDTADALVESSVQHLEDIAQSSKQQELQFDAVNEIPEASYTPPLGMQLVSSTDYQALRECMVSAADEIQALEGELSQKQGMIEQLSEDNDRLELEVFKLAEAYEKKELLVSQLREALKVLEQRAIPLTIEERAALHSRNQAASKT